MAVDMGAKMKMLRERKEMTLEEVGDMVGVGKSTVRKWETGAIANMGRDKIALVAHALDVSPSYLMGWDEEETISALDSVEFAEVTLQLQEDEDLFQALKVYFKMSPDKKRHIIDEIRFLGGM